MRLAAAAPRNYPRWYVLISEKTARIGTAHDDGFVINLTKIFRATHIHVCGGHLMVSLLESVQSSIAFLQQN